MAIAVLSDLKCFSIQEEIRTMILDTPGQNVLAGLTNFLGFQGPRQGGFGTGVGCAKGTRKTVLPGLGKHGGNMRILAKTADCLVESDDVSEQVAAQAVRRR
jgi:hypothetical protein